MVEFKYPILQKPYMMYVMISGRADTEEAEPNAAVRSGAAQASCQTRWAQQD